VEVNIQPLSEVSHEVEIKATQEDLAPHFDRAYQEYRKKVEIRGFRKGKAPLDIVKKLYGDMIENDSLSEVANDMYRQVVKEKELKPIGEPVLVDMTYKRGESFRCRIQYDTRPKIELKDYRNIEVEKFVHTVNEDEVAKELLRLQQINAKMDEADAVTDDQYIITATLQDMDDKGEPVAGRRSENIRFYLADDRLEKPIKDALKEAKTGGEYRVKFEHMHGDKSHTVDTLVSVHKIQKITLPVLDDAFIAGITKNKFTTVESLRANIRTDLEAYWREKSDRQVLNSIIAEIIRRHEFLIPESLVRSVLMGLLEEVRNEYPGKQLPADFDLEKFNNENREYAVYQAKWALLREELIKAEKFTVADDDLEKLAQEESEKIKIPKDRLIGYYRTSEQVKDRIVGEKLIQLLKNTAKIKERPDKE
jgi:trigger factor